MSWGEEDEPLKHFSGAPYRLLGNWKEMWMDFFENLICDQKQGS